MAVRNKIEEPVNSSAEGSVLAELFRNIIADLKIGKEFEDVLNKSANKNEKVTVHSLKSKSNLDNMSFKVFIHLLKYVIHAVSIRITVELKYYNNETRIHSTREIKLKDLK